MINLLFGGNAKVIDGLVTCLMSIVKHCREPLNINIMTADLLEHNAESVSVTDAQINFLNGIVKAVNEESIVTKTDYSRFKEALLSSINVDTEYSPYSFLRLYSDEFDLPEKVLYLDVDIMACGDISELYNIDITNYEYAAVKDYYGSFFYNRKYTNSGVMLLNYKKIRETGMFKKARQLVIEKKLLLPDQHAINRNTTAKLILPTRFNSQKRLKKNTLLRHFSKTILFFPWFHTKNIKQWHIDRLHNEYKCFAFDDILNEYLKLKENNKEVFLIKGDK